MKQITSIQTCVAILPQLTMQRNRYIFLLYVHPKRITQWNFLSHYHYILHYVLLVSTHACGKRKLPLRMHGIWNDIFRWNRFSFTLIWKWLKMVFNLAFYDFHFLQVFFKNVRFANWKSVNDIVFHMHFLKIYCYIISYIQYSLHLKYVLFQPRDRTQVLYSAW